MSTPIPRVYWAADLWVIIPQNGFINIDSARIWADCQSASEEATRRNTDRRKPKRPWTVVTLARALTDRCREAEGEFERVAG